MKRLEDLCQPALFFRDGRKLTLTPAGEMLLDYARTILKSNDDAVEALVGERAIGAVRIGMIEDFARTLLAGALRRFSATNPEAQIQLRVCGSQELRELMAANRLDIALYLSPANADGVEVRRDTSWIGDEELARREVLPLALLEKPCLFRDQALEALEAAGLRYEVVVETSSVSSLHAAVEAGLAITPRIAWPSGSGKRVGTLPPLPQVGINATTSNISTRAIRTLRSILLEALGDL